MSSKGAFDFDNPLKVVILVGMVFVWLFWIGQTNTSLNAIGGNSTIVGKFCCASTSAYGATSWLLWIMFSPFALMLFINWVAHKTSEDEHVSLGSAAEGSESSGGEMGPLGELRSKLTASHRRTRRRISDLARLGEDEGDEG